MTNKNLGEEELRGKFIELLTLLAVEQKTAMEELKSYCDNRASMGKGKLKLIEKIYTVVIPKK
ncbi:MAG: hypothetical protein WC511_01815 [Candidatus Pacearchaeota archaeon]